jgi:hypothetical protein
MNISYRLSKLEQLEQAVISMIELSTESPYEDQRDILLTDFESICAIMVELGYEDYKEYVPSYKDETP